VPCYPYYTIKEAEKAAKSGDTIVVFPRPLPYQESIYTEKKLTILAPKGADATVWKWGTETANPYVIRFAGPGASNSRLEGFTLIGSGKAESPFCASAYATSLSSAGAAKDVVFARNRFKNCPYAVQFHHFTTGSVQSSLFVEGCNTAIFVDGAASASAYNNTFASGNACDDHGAVDQWMNNLSLATATKCASAKDSSNNIVGQKGEEGSGFTYVQDPLLVDPAGGDYHLQAKSDLCKDGKDLGILVPLDLDGKKRPGDDGKFAVGAYECDPVP
jgi:hypothetical protein